MSDIRHKVDRSGWKCGPWCDEGDRLDFEAHGLPCFLLRHPRGFWCGYAGVSAAHPLYGKHYNRCALPEPCRDEDGELTGYCEHSPSAVLRVHRGLSYSNACSPPICHVPKPGESDDVHWFGFDCGNLATDEVPGMPELYELRMQGTYRDQAYAREQTEQLAQQLAEWLR